MHNSLNCTARCLINSRLQYQFRIRCPSVKSMTTILGSKSVLLEIVESASLLSSMQSVLLLEQWSKMKSQLSFTLKLLIILTMLTNTRLYTSTCPARNAIISTSTSTLAVAQLVFTCSTSRRDLALKKLNSGFLKLTTAIPQ